MSIPQIKGPSVWDSRLELESIFNLTPAILDALVTSEVATSIGKKNYKSDDTISEILQYVNNALFRGVGFTLIKGFPIDEWGFEKTSQIYQFLGAQLGILRHQNAKGDLLHLVTDKTVLGVSAKDAGGSNSRKRIILHTENARPPHPPRILSLLCLKKGLEGGESILMSGHTIHNKLTHFRSDLLARSYKDFIFGRHDEVFEDGKVVDLSPIFRIEDQKIHFRYSRYWLDVAVNTINKTYTEQELEVLNFIDMCLEDDSASIKLLLNPGDAIFINNRVVMHGRESFIDSQILSDRRCLFRIWMD